MKLDLVFAKAIESHDFVNHSLGCIVRWYGSTEIDVLNASEQLIEVHSFEFVPSLDEVHSFAEGWFMDELDLRRMRILT